MGRTLKRVALDFDWPWQGRDKVWKGYINPHQPDKCRVCDGTGYGPEAKRFQDEWYGRVHFDPVAYGSEPLSFESPNLQRFAERNVESAPEYYGKGEQAIYTEKIRLFTMWRSQWGHQLRQEDVDALVSEERLKDFTRVPLNEQQREDVRMKMENGGNKWLPYDNGHHPTAAEVNEWSLLGLGHDSINQSICVEARCKREGFEVSCRKCGGEGYVFATKELEALHDEWENYEPPEGEGYQLWETTSEGSPVSPVFETIEELCEWCEDNATTFASFKTTAEHWREMLEKDFVRHEDKEKGIVFL